MKLEAQWIVGFVDGEGCFSVSINKNAGITLKLQVIPEFVVVQHERDIKILHALKEYFKCGVVRRNHGDSFCYRVRGNVPLNSNIIPFFEAHSLKTAKKVDFLKFRSIILLMEAGEHLTSEGLVKIDAIIQTMNNRAKPGVIYKKNVEILLEN